MTNFPIDGPPGLAAPTGTIDPGAYRWQVRERGGLADEPVDTVVVRDEDVDPVATDDGRSSEVPVPRRHAAVLPSVSVPFEHLRAVCPAADGPALPVRTCPDRLRDVTREREVVPPGAGELRGEEQGGGEEIAAAAAGEARPAVHRGRAAGMRHRAVPRPGRAVPEENLAVFRQRGALVDVSHGSHRARQRDLAESGSLRAQESGGSVHRCVARVRECNPAVAHRGEHAAGLRQIAYRLSGRSRNLEPRGPRLQRPDLRRRRDPDAIAADVERPDPRSIHAMVRAGPDVPALWRLEVAADAGSLQDPMRRRGRGGGRLLRARRTGAALTRRSRPLRGCGTWTLCAIARPATRHHRRKHPAD